MRFGINFFPSVDPRQLSGHAYYQQALALAARADELGYHHIRTVEHYFRGYGGYSPSPIVFLTAVAQRTRRVRLVTGAVLPAFNHPIKLAAETGGRYLFGGPADDPQDRVWGLPVRQTTEMPLGTALVGSRPYAELLRREEVVVTLSTEHSTYFIENKIAVLAESRFGLAVYRPSAFCSVTGLT